MAAAYRPKLADRPVFGPRDLCPDCFDHYRMNPMLSAACASVGIEHGKSTGLILAEYFDAYHARGHRDP